METWVDGGWGIDALLGVETRQHSDLDLAVSNTDLAGAVSALAKAGFAADEAAIPGLPARLVLRDHDGRHVDLHPLKLDEHGNGWQELGDDAWGLYPADGLGGSGTVGGVAVRCLTADLQLRHHLGWSLTDTSRADLARLGEKFGLPVPPG